MNSKEKPESVDLSDDKQFKALFEQLYASLHHFAKTYVLDEDIAADIVQECFVKLWQEREKYVLFPQIKSFLYISVKNRSLNELEHNRVVSEHAKTILDKDEEAFFRDHLIEEEVYRLLFSAIESLPTQTQKVMKASLEGLSYAEVAEQMDVSVETVRTLKKEGYKKIRKYMGQYYLLLPLVLISLLK